MDDVHGVIADILRQQGEDGMQAHNDTDPNADLQMGILFVRASTLFVEKLGSAPEKGSANGEEQPGHRVTFFLLLFRILHREL